MVRKTMKKYFSKYEDYCMSLSEWKRYIDEHNIDEIELFEAEIEYGTGYFWCGIFYEIGESKISCGKMCKGYIPRNGKNGRCIYNKSPYAQTDKVKILKL